MADDSHQPPRPSRSHQAMRARARELRQTQTPAEQLLWRALRGQQLGVKFRRQHPIGRFIADFCCLEHRLIIELDGHVHTRQEEYDQARTEALAATGFRVLRFSNQEVLHERSMVIERIRQALASEAAPDQASE